jgi:MFS family permease
MPFASQLVQLPAAWIVSMFGRRRVAILSVGASRQIPLVLCALPALPLSTSAKQLLLLAVGLTSALLAVIGNNAWTSWMGDLVPARMRGRYFGMRTAVTTIGGALASIAAGVVLDRAHVPASTGLALSGLALAGAVAGVATTLLMMQQHEPLASATKRQAVRAQDVLAPLLDPRSRDLLYYQVSWYVGVGVCGGLYAVHMLVNLKMRFALVALHGTTVAFARVLAAPAWGRMLDRHGPGSVLVLCSLGLALLPALWLLPSPTFLAPLALDAVLAGVFWGGHGLAIFALPLRIAPDQGRPFYLAAFSFAGGLSFAVAAAAGGWLASALPVHVNVLGREMFGMQSLFALALVVRLFAARLAVRRLLHATEPVAAAFAAR